MAHMADSLGGAGPWVPPYERKTAAPKVVKAPAPVEAPRAAPAVKAPTVRATAKVPTRAASHHRITGTSSPTVKKLAAVEPGKPSTVKSAAGGAVAGAVAGAEIGSIVPGVGTAIGAGVGAVAGGGLGAVKGKKAKAAAKSATRQARRAELGSGRSILMAEFLLCLVILALSPLTDKHREEDPRDFLKRGAATLFLFFVLGLISSGGRGPSRVAAAGGGVVTLTLLVSSRDVFTQIADLLTGTGGRADDPGTGLSPDGSTIDSAGTPGVGLGPDGTPLDSTGSGGGGLGPAGGMFGPSGG